MEQIPIVDLSTARTGDLRARHAVAKRIDGICREIGFFTITGHGVPLDVMDALRSRAHAFFALPLDEKRKAINPVANAPRGYRALGIEALGRANAGASPPDLKEFYHIGREAWPDEPYYTGAEGRRYFIPNFWPPAPSGPSGLSGSSSLSQAAARYYAEMESVVGLMLRLTALAMDRDEHFFVDKTDKHISAMRLNFYPEQTERPSPGQLRAGAHTDYGTFTILNGENVPGGLQVLTRKGEWIDVETDPANFVVNIGDLLMRWTNDRWISNLHRVVNPPAAVAARTKRLSIAFFHQPNYDAMIECIAPPGQAKYPPVRSGDYRDLKYRQTAVA
jgi:isopenicillin N synthase-like dioxygenase